MDGLGLPEKRTGRESSLGSVRCTTAGRGATAELIRWYLEHPRQGGAGMRPWLNCSKLNLSWETVSVYIRRHSSTGRKARYLFFGKITNVHQGSEPPSGSRGIFFINLTGQTKTSEHLGVSFHTHFLSPCAGLGTDLTAPHIAPFHSQNHSRELQWLHFSVEEVILREKK